MRVEIFSDVVCPWCYIGKRRLESAVENLTAAGRTPDVEIEFRPFQLDPAAALDAATPVWDAYAKKFGSEQRATEIITHVTEIAAKDNIMFRMDRALRANTMFAHRLSYIALRDFGCHVQTRLEELLFKSYFTDGANIGDIDVLTACADEVGMDGALTRIQLLGNDALAEVEAELRLAAEIGISAVPTFVFDGKWSVPGAQDVEVFERVLLRLTERAD
ncbi:MAG: DsbA family oxidoreductase [Ilumatobacteraceae bacterium]